MLFVLFYDQGLPMPFPTTAWCCLLQNYFRKMEHVEVIITVYYYCCSSHKQPLKNYSHYSKGGKKQVLKSQHLSID